MMTKQREAITTTLQPSMHTRLHGVLHFAAPSCLGSQEEIILLPKKTRLCASRPQQPLSSPQKKKKKQKKHNPEPKKFRISNFQLQIQQSGNANHRLKLQEIANKSKNFHSKKQFCCYGKPKSASKTQKPPEEAQKTL
jgi:hypothetical protein